MIYKYVWQTCQQSLKIISIEQSFVRGNYTFSELCSSRKYPYPHPAPPPPTEDRNSKGRGGGGPKGGNLRGVGGLLTVAYRGFLTRHPSPVTRYPSPATRYPPPTTRHPPPVTCHPRKSPAERWTITEIRLQLNSVLTNSLLTDVRNICKPEEGWYGQSKYCYKKNNTRSYDQLCSSLIQRDCKPRRYHYNKGLRPDEKRRTADSFVVNKPSVSPETE